VGGTKATLLGGAFCEAKYEKLRRRKSEGGAGIHFPHTPFSSRPARAKKFSALPREARQSKFKVRIFVKKSSDFVQKVPPIYNFGVFEGCCLTLAEFIPHRACSGAGLGLGKNYDFIRIFKIKKQFSLQNLKVRFAEDEHKLKNY
jgi:hypothetical protein